MAIARKIEAQGKVNMSYIEAESIKQDFLVSIQYADSTGQTREAAYLEVAEKYTAEQLSEAYTVLKNKMKEEMDLITSLFSVAIRSKR